MNLFIQNLVIVLLLLVCFRPGAAIGNEAGVVVLHSGTDSVELGEQVKYLHDKSGKLSFRQVQHRLDLDLFESSGSTGLNFGFTSDAYWYHFVLQNDASSEQKNWVLEIAWPPLDLVDVYVVKNSDLIKEVHTGDQRPPGSTGIAHRNYAIGLEIPSGSSVSVFIRAQLEGAHQLPMTLWAADRFFAKTNSENLLYGMFYGIVAVMVIYNLLIYLSIRDIAYLYYILFIFWLGVVQLSLDGFAFPVLWWIAPEFVNKSLSVFIALSTVFVPLFIRTSLQTKVTAPRFHRLLGWAIAVAASCLLLPLFISVKTSIFIVVLVAAMTTLLMALLLLTQALKGQRTAQYYVVVWGALVIGIVAKVMQTNGLLPITFLTTYALHIGLCFLVTLVSLGLADQINRERRERERLAHEHELSESKAKIDFLGKMSHELRTPMNAIVGFTKLAQDSGSETEREEHIGHIAKASHSMRRVLDDVLSLTGIETGSLKLKEESFSLLTVIDQAMSLVEHEASEKGLELMLQVDQAVPDLLMGDGPHLEQVLMNLVGNAVKFTEKGFVRLEVQAPQLDKERVQLSFSVQDSGIGLTAEQKAGLFSPFTQGDQSLSRKYGGSGLGLVICKRLVELMGGRIEVESEPGRGSKFSFRLAFKVSTEAPIGSTGQEADKPEDSPETDFSNMTVLVVDDNSLNRRLASEILEDVGVTVDLAENGQEAVDAVRARTYDAVLMDLQMPVMDGLQATRTIRSLDKHANVPIIAMTANAMASDRENAIAMGMNDFLPKPVDSEKLFQLLGQWALKHEDSRMSSASQSPGHEATTTDIPDQLPGIDFHDALKRLGGRKKLLLDLLEEFAADQQGAAEKISALWRDGSQEEAIREAHSLKGMAANVGCTDLAETAARVEMMLKGGGSEDIDAVFGKMSVQLQEVKKSVESLASPSPAPEATAVMSGAEYSSRVAELMAMIVSRDFSVQSRFDELKPSLARNISPAELESLATAIHGFDFDTAANILGNSIS